MKKLELKIPPVGVFLVTVLLMWGLGLWTPGYAFHPLFRAVAVAVCLCVGAVFGLGALVSFRRKRTTVNPLEPDLASALVTEGVFRFSRNPMYLALFFVLLAIGFVLSNLYSLAAAMVFVPYMNRFQIRPEERFMDRCFGEDYRNYRARVRRWI